MLLLNMKAGTKWRFVRSFSELAFEAPPPAPTRRVVVTGMGAVTPFGVGVEHSWEKLLDSKTAVDVSD
jgi:hypothetical protein